MDDWQSFLQSCPQEVYTGCTVVINGDTFPNVGVRAERDDTVTDMGSCRYSLKLVFDHYDSDQRYYGLDQLELRNLLHDNTMMKDYLSYQLMAQLGAEAPLCSYTTVYVNRKSLGLYLAVEALGESFLQRTYGSDHGRLYLPEAVSGESAPDTKLQYLGDDPDSYPNLFNHSGTDITEEDKLRLIRSLKQLSTGKDLKNTVDIEAVIRYFTVNTFLCNEDSYTGSPARNYCLYEKDGRLSMLPRRCHLAFGGNATGSAASVINASIYKPVSGGTHADRPMLAWILENKRYTWLYQRYHMELLNVETEAMVERTEKMLAPYVLRDPTRFCTYEEFMAGVDTLKQFLELRSESIQQQLLENTATVDVGELELSAMGGIPAQP